MRGMKPRHLFAGLLLVAGSLFAADRRSIQDKPQMQSMTVTPLYDEAGKVTAMSVTVKYAVTSMQPDGKTPQRLLTTIDVDLVAQSKNQVLVKNELVVLGDSAEELTVLAEAIWNQQHPPPLPVRRRALREAGAQKQP